MNDVYPPLFFNLAMPNPLEMECLMENRLTTGSYPLPCLMIRGDIG